MSVPEPPPFAIDVDENAAHVVLRLSGELDLATAPELETAITQRLRDGRTVVVDLRGLVFMDSSGVRTLVTGHGTAQEGDGTLVIVRPPRGGEVDSVIEISGIAEALGMVDEPPA